MGSAHLLQWLVIRHFQRAVTVVLFYSFFGEGWRLDLLQDLAQFSHWEIPLFGESMLRCFFFVGSFYATPRLGDFSGNRCLLKTPSSVGYAVQGREELFKVVDSLYVGSPRVSGPDSMGRIASRQHRQGNSCCCGVRTVVMDTWGASQFASGLSSKFIAELPSGYLT